MGQAVTSIIKNVLDDNGIADDPERMREVEDRIMQLKENMEMKLEAFYQQKVLDATGKGNTLTVPICNVVSRVQSVYAIKQEVIQKTLLNTITSIIDDALEGQWKRSISKLIQGGLESFFGPSEISRSGETMETKLDNVIWSNNSMVRLDIFVTKTSLGHKVGLKKSESELFGGYVMVTSVVDLAKINWQVFVFTFSKFFENMKAEDENAADRLLENIEETARLLDATGKLMDEARIVKREASKADPSPKALHQEYVKEQLKKLETKE